MIFRIDARISSIEGSWARCSAAVDSGIAEGYAVMASDAFLQFGRNGRHHAAKGNQTAHLPDSLAPNHFERAATRGQDGVADPLWTGERSLAAVRRAGADPLALDLVEVNRRVVFHDLQAERRGGQAPDR